MTPVRVTPQTRRVLMEFLKAPDEELYGRQISTETGLRPGTIHPILNRLEEAGVLISRWEPRLTGVLPGRPSRHYFRLTSDGWAFARQETILERNST